jgi:hypothetical protein
VIIGRLQLLIERSFGKSGMLISTRNRHGQAEKLAG